MRPANPVIGNPQRKSTAILRWLSRLSLLVGLFALGYAAYFYVTAYAFQKNESILFDRPRTPDAPLIDHIIPEGGVIARIEIGRLGLSAIVVEGDSPSLLRRAVGHVPDTAMPGESGNIALTAHRDTYFRSLRNIHEGDVITLETMGGEYIYEVLSTSIVPPTDVSVLEATSDRELTLITCYPFYYIGPAPRRFVVRARKVGHPRE